MRIKGKLTSWNDARGFGFITPNGGGKPIFVHIKAFNNRKKSLVIDQLVTYTISTDRQGRPCAEEVTRAGELLSKNTKKGRNSFAHLVPVLFIAMVSVSVLTNKIPFLVLVFYLALSFFTFILYAVDKSAAQHNSWRTSEGTLHLFALAGGWPGAMIAQQTLRHKSKKQSFRAVFWITVLLNLGIFIGLHSSKGRAILNSMLNNALY